MPLFLRSLFAAALAAALVVTPGATRDASAGPIRYVSGGTAVARANGQPVVDEGSVVCDHADGVGAGGLCLPFGGGDAVHLVDDVAGENVAFQACIDNSGDGVCTSPDFGACADVTFFSHDDNGGFHNPVGPMPTGFTSGCAGGPWKGYVVFLCEGAHTVGTDTHTHNAASGSGAVTSGGEGNGTFCGGWGPAPSRKPYSVGSGARYVSGGTAASRENGTTVVDEGSVVCNNGNNEGIGGFCTSFGGGNAMAVFDALGTDVAFQVCIDNNADGFCTSPDPDWSCPDYIAFSHDDSGAFFNPVGPLPTGFSSGCGGPRAWQGYVVFLCEGTHVAGISPHAHAATTGTGRVTTGGEGTGNFCGGTYAAPSRKRYRLNLSASVPDVGSITSGGDTCVLSGLSQEQATGQSAQGTIQGHATAAKFGGDPAGSITLRCDVRVNGSVVAQSATASGTGSATVAPQTVSFVATDVDTLEVCAVVTTAQGSQNTCDEATTTEAPPQEVQDLVDGVDDVPEQVAADAQSAAQSFLHPILCPLLVPFAGQYGIVKITPEGDVFAHGEHLLDCPPYTV